MTSSRYTSTSASNRHWSGGRPRGTMTPPTRRSLRVHVLATIESVQTTAAAIPSPLVNARIFSDASLASESSTRSGLRPSGTSVARSLPACRVSSAIVVKPKAFANWTPKCPKPPIPTMATVAPGSRPAVAFSSAPHTVAYEELSSALLAKTCRASHSGGAFETHPSTHQWSSLFKRQGRRQQHARCRVGSQVLRESTVMLETCRLPLVAESRIKVLVAPLRQRTANTLSTGILEVQDADSVAYLP